MTATHEVPVKLYQAGDRLTLAASMPGYGPEDIDVEIRSDGHLLITAQLCDAAGCGALKSPSKEVMLDEWSLGPVRRDVSLPRPVDGESATITYGNGVLVVSAPVAAATRPASLRLTATAPTRGVGGVIHPTA